MEPEEKERKKTHKTRWFIPLILSLLSFAWEVSCFGLEKVVLAKGIFAFFGIYIFYNWIMSWIKDKPGKKPPTIEFFLAIPTLSLIILASVLPFPYVRRWALTGLFTLIGYLFWVFALGFLNQEKGLRKTCTAPATAVVIDNMEDRVSHKPGELSVPTFYPILFYYAGGKQREQRLDNGQARPMEIGKKLEILYNPDKPEEFCFAEEGTDRTAVIMVPLFMIIGSVLFVLAVLSYLLKWSF